MVTGMEDLAAVGAVATSLKPTIDIAKSLMDALGVGKGREKAIELVSQLLSAQEAAISAKSAQQALIARIGELEAKVGEFERWDREKERYNLDDIGGGILAYTLKFEATGPEPPHHLCPRCFQHRIKSILQLGALIERYRSFVCPECKTVFAQTPGRHPMLVV